MLTVPGAPIPKARPRVYAGRGVTPKRTREAEDRIRALWAAQYPSMQPLTGDVHVGLDFYLPDRRARDWDNLAKLVTDALNGLAYEDDRQIVSAIVIKWLPSLLVPGRDNKPRKRRAGDPLTTDSGNPYDPHTLIRLIQVDEPEETDPDF